jgi:hypothetical protein
VVVDHFPLPVFEDENVRRTQVRRLVAVGLETRDEGEFTEQVRHGAPAAQA